MGNQESYNISPDSENINLTDKHLTKLPFTPPEENRAKNLYLSGNKFVALPENMKNVILVDLSKNHMAVSIPVHVAKALVSYPNLKKLNLSSNQLEKLNDILKSNKIESLNLVQNRFNDFPDQLIVRFPVLETFSFDCNFLKAFSKLQSEIIVTLTMSLNCIQSIETSTISLPQLTTLDLSKNQIKAIPDNLSKSFPSLKSLDLSDNFISDIPEINSETSDNFVFPKTLVEINLTHNFLQKIPKSIICLPNLTELIVAENKITNLPEVQPSLQKLDVSSNQINSISKQTMKGIKEILLTDNELSEFTTGVEMNACESFVLDHNQVKELNFSKIPNTIVDIEISFNQIEKLPIDFFESLPNLQSFTANFNKITEIPPSIINCNKLQRFSISYNPIKNLPKMPISLQSITASNCQLGNLDGIFFGIKQPSRYYSTVSKDVERSSDTNFDEFSPNNFHSQGYSASYVNLKYADFSGNQLETFPDMHDLQILNLSHNRLKKLPTISNRTKILDVSMNQINSEPGSMPGIISGTALVDLNLSHNKITKIPKFQNVPLLQCLELSGNPLTGVLDITELIFLDTVDISSTSISSINSNNELLREVITSNKDFTISSSQIALKMEPKPTSAAKKKVLYVNQKVNEEGKLKTGFSEILGLRNSMEDSIIVRDDLNLYAVCDGHGGSNTAKYIAIKISDLFEKKLEMQARQISMNKSMRIKSNLFTFEKVKHLIESIIAETNRGLQHHNFVDGSTLCLCYLHNESGNSNESSNSAPASSSDEKSEISHVTKKLITANMGDSRAIIVRKDGTSRELTKDHKPFFRSEFERIHNEFGKISKDNRVDGILAVSRALGDFNVKGVCREADIEEFEIDDNMDKFLVIGCDGVFDVLTNDEVAQVVINAPSPTEAAFMIRNAAFGVQSSDNISVIVVDLTQNLS